MLAASERDLLDQLAVALGQRAVAERERDVYRELCMVAVGQLHAADTRNRRNAEGIRQLVAENRRLRPQTTRR